MIQRRAVSLLRRMLRRFTIVAGAGAFALLCFMVLPLIQAITAPPDSEMELQTVDAGNIPPPPPPPPEEEPEKEEEPEEPPPELADDPQPLDLSQLEMMFNQGVGTGGWMGGDFDVKLNVAGGDGEGNGLFSIADLDQRPRPKSQQPPVHTAKTRKRAPGKVYIIFIVDENGRVVNPTVQSSTDPVFERPALAAVKKWTFEPGKRQGKPVRFRMRVPITFPKT